MRIILISVCVARGGLAGCGGSELDGRPTDGRSSPPSIPLPTPRSSSAAARRDVDEPDAGRGRAARPRAPRRATSTTVHSRRPRPADGPRLPAAARDAPRPARTRACSRCSTRPGLDRHGNDPHVWLDPLRYALLVERIGAALHRRPPAAARRPAARARPRVPRAASPTARRREIVTSHAAFGYLAAAVRAAPDRRRRARARRRSPRRRTLATRRRRVRARRRDHGLRRDARLAAARRDGRAGDRRADRRARPDRGADAEAGRARRRLLHASCARTSPRSEGRSDAASRRARRTSPSATAAACRCSRDVDLAIAAGRVRRDRRAERRRQDDARSG